MAAALTWATSLRKGHAKANVRISTFRLQTLFADFDAVFADFYVIHMTNHVTSYICRPRSIVISPKAVTFKQTTSEIVSVLRTSTTHGAFSKKIYATTYSHSATRQASATATVADVAVRGPLAR